MKDTEEKEGDGKGRRGTEREGERKGGRGKKKDNRRTPERLIFTEHLL